MFLSKFVNYFGYSSESLSKFWFFEWKFVQVSVFKWRFLFYWSKFAHILVIQVTISPNFSFSGVKVKIYGFCSKFVILFWFFKWKCVKNSFKSKPFKIWIIWVKIDQFFGKKIIALINNIQSSMSYHRWTFSRPGYDHCATYRRDESQIWKKKKQNSM